MYRRHSGRYLIERFLSTAGVRVCMMHPLDPFVEDPLISVNHRTTHLKNISIKFSVKIISVLYMFHPVIHVSMSCDGVPEQS